MIRKSVSALWFMLRQPVLYWPALAGAAAWIVFCALEPQPEATAVTYVVLVAIAPLMGFAFAFLTGLPAFLLWRLFKHAPIQCPQLSDEAPLGEWRANHYLGQEGRGGKLLVTDRRLLFVPHRFNFQLSTWEIERDAITAVAWRNAVNPLNGQRVTSMMSLTTTAGSETFVIARAEEAAEQIDRLRAERQARATA